MQRGSIVQENGEFAGKRIPIVNSLIIGRDIDCDLMISDKSASRKHIEIKKEEGVFRLKDMGSLNASLVNGVRVRECLLQNGDHIQIGDIILSFQIEEDKANTTMLFCEDLVPKIITKQSQGESKSKELLQAVYALMNTISSNYETCSLIDQILEMTMKAIHAKHGAIFFAQESTKEELCPCPVCNHIHMIEGGKLRHANPGEIKISNTVAKQVLNKGESILYLHDREEQELNNAQSIIFLQLRSIICVPLRGKYRILGILYMDSDRPSNLYTHEDMLLSAAVGNSAGLALENAQMHQQILEKKRMDQEIEHAGIIQEGFLFREWPEKDKHFEVYGETRPAKIIGGDFYDFIRQDENHIGILIGDVSGKGMPAALFMAQLLASFRIHARQSLSPDVILRLLNEEMVKRSQRGMFCTVCYFILDLQNGNITCANAGHHPAILSHKTGSELFAQASGPPIGILPEIEWKISEAKLSSGDAILMITDGICEARAFQKSSETSNLFQEYGIESVRQKAQDMYSEPPRKLIEELNRNVQKHCFPMLPHDDCTSIAVKYLGCRHAC